MPFGLDKIRNPLTHTTQSIASIGRDAKHDISTMEKLTFNMIKGTVMNWQIESTLSEEEDEYLQADDIAPPKYPDVPKDDDDIPSLKN